MLSLAFAIVQGYIALVAMIFGKWRPVPALIACLMFGLLDAISIRLQGVELAVIGEVPVQLIQKKLRGHVLT